MSWIVLINISFQFQTQDLRKGGSVGFAHSWFINVREFLISKGTLGLKCAADDTSGGGQVKECVPRFCGQGVGTVIWGDAGTGS
jgi:hypothetical protein